MAAHQGEAGLLREPLTPAAMITGEHRPGFAFGGLSWLHTLPLRDGSSGNQPAFEVIWLSPGGPGCAGPC